MDRTERRAGSLRQAAVAIAVAVAFADSSIVVLALPELYGRFDTTIVGISWVITAYNVALAACALALLFVLHRARAHRLLAIGSLVFLGASVACALADSLGVLVVARSVQGVGGALLLAGALPVLGTLTPSSAGAAALWTAAGTIGAALGPALGGVLTQAFDWRAIFLAQAPIAGAALLGSFGPHVGAIPTERWRSRPWRTAPANVALGLVFGALVGTLFLGVLLVVDVFGFPPIQGAAIVSTIPAAALLATTLDAHLPRAVAVGGGAALLAFGLLGLALLPSSELVYVLGALASCGLGLGLSIPALTGSALVEGGDVGRTGTLTVGARHLGLVLALAFVAPILAGDLTDAVDVATLNGTAVVLDGRIPATTKVPLALAIRDILEEAPKGEIPDLAGPFEEHGSRTDADVRRVQDDLVNAMEAAITRGFRTSFLFCATLAMLTVLVALVSRRRWAT